MSHSRSLVHPKSHALSHLVDTNSIDQYLSDAFSFSDSSNRNNLLDILTDTFDDLQVRFPDHCELDIQSARKRRRDPQWKISDSACKAYHAISRCRHGSSNCSVIEGLETLLALATYSNLIDEESHFVDALFALDTEKPVWDEVRIHTHSLVFTSTVADTRAAVPTVKFADARGKFGSAAREWWLNKPKRIPHFCQLLDQSMAHIRATRRLNITLDAEKDMWQHLPTDRFLMQDDLSESVSLTGILASDTRYLSDMSKLVLAVILSYSFFYLYQGPWLGTRNVAGLSREKIIFFKKDGKVTLRPFLRSDIRGNTSNSSEEDNEGDDDDASFHQYPAILDFGIILLEINLGCTLESFLRLTEPLTAVNDKWAHACHVFKMRQPNIRWLNYSNAIKACLDARFGAGDDNEHNDWEDAEKENTKRLRGLIFSKIVGPLQDDLEGAFGKFNDLDKQAANMDLGSGLPVAETHPEKSSLTTRTKTVNSSRRTPNPRAGSHRPLSQAPVAACKQAAVTNRHQRNA